MAKKEQKVDYLNVYPMGLGLTRLYSEFQTVSGHPDERFNKVVSALQIANYVTAPASHEELEKTKSVNNIGLLFYNMDGLNAFQHNVDVCRLMLLEMDESLKTKEGYLKAIDDLENSHHDLKKEIGDLYAVINAKFSVGDIIMSQKRIIEITEIGFNKYSRLPSVYYHGKLMTKSIKPRKDNETLTIFEDEKIDLIKKSKK